MAQEDPNRWAQWVVLVRNQWPVVRKRVTDWLEACREEPTLIWQTAEVRYATYGLGLVLALWAASAVSATLVPPLPAAAKLVADTADFHVVCDRAECHEHFVVHRRFGFDDFPVRCPACRELSGRLARQCHSTTCRGRWVVPLATDAGPLCPRCDEPLDGRLQAGD